MARNNQRTKCGIWHDPQIYLVSNELLFSNVNNKLY